MADYYQALAADYDWIFDDDALARGLAITHPATARLLERTSTQQRRAGRGLRHRR